MEEKKMFRLGEMKLGTGRFPPNFAEMMERDRTEECNVTKRARANPGKGANATPKSRRGKGIREGMSERSGEDKREPKRRKTED